MKDIFAGIGVICTFTLCGFLFGMFMIFIQEKIRILKRRYQYKHRFDKPPTAKCYCIDCKHHGKDGKCNDFVMYIKTEDEWFCWRAEPRE